MNDLFEFLSEAQLHHYYQKFVSNLKVTNLSQLRYVEDEDLVDIGMSQSEVARMKLQLRKKFPHGAFGQIKKLFGKGRENRCERSQSLSERDRRSMGPSEKHVIHMNSVTMSHQLGTGRFGSVVRLGVWTKADRMQVQVAVKCLPKANLQKPVGDFLQETSALFNISHPHLIQIFGVILDIDNILLVMEHAPLQSLIECLKDTSLRTSLSVRLLCDLSKQIADGMAYLEQHQLVHGNLSARNILVISIYQVKITDFGLSGAVGFDNSVIENKHSDEFRLILQWCAPECAQSFAFTSASDVWSFGVTLWEIFSYGSQPWLGLSASEIIEAVSPPANSRLPKPRTCPDDWYAEMLRCWQFEPKNRPKFSDLFSVLSQIKLSRVVVQKDDFQSYAGCIQCKKSDIITVLSKNPEKSPSSGFWLGVVDATNEIGFFEPNNTSPHLEIIISDINLQRNPKISRSWSLRASLRPSSRKLTPSMISMPQNDMRHIGHVGFDGVVIGDVPFLSSSRSSSLSSTMLDRDSQSSTASLPINGNSVSQLKPLSFGNSVSSSSIFTGSGSGRVDRVDLSDDGGGSCGITDLKLPDLTDDLNFGGSLFDEVMAALNQALNNRGVPTSGLDSSFSSDDCDTSLKKANVTTASSNSTIVAESRSGHTSESEDDKAVTSVHGLEEQERLSRGQAKFSSSAYGIYSVQNATGCRKEVNIPNRESVTRKSNSLKLPEGKIVMSGTTSDVTYVNIPVSQVKHSLAVSTAVQDLSRFRDSGIYLEPRRTPDNGLDEKW